MPDIQRDQGVDVVGIVITLGRFLPFHSISVDPAMFHFRTPRLHRPPFPQDPAFSPVPIPPRLPIVTGSVTPGKPLSLPMKCSLSHSAFLTLLTGPRIDRRGGPSRS